jgi:glycosyltransferase involved in cell wall biosynthesis
MSGVRLLLLTDAVGGVWVYSLELARALKPLGIETVTAVVGPPPNVEQCAEAAEFSVIATGLPLDWGETERDELLRAGEAVREIADHVQADVVQTCSSALLAGAELSQPAVAVQHSCVASWWAAVKGTPLPEDFEWRRELAERGLNRAAAVIAPSRSFAAETARTYGLRRPVVCVHNGRGSHVQPGIGRADFVFTASRLWDEGKNVATLDAAAAKLNVPFEAAGAVRGPNRTGIVLEHVKPIGEVDPVRLSGLLSARPVYASAALYEPFGLSVLEAAKAGCALVLSDIPTHRELWGGAATFVPARDADGFAGAIQRLLDRPAERAEHGRLASARARRFTPERTAERMAEIYAGLAARSLAYEAVAAE